MHKATQFVFYFYCLFSFFTTPLISCLFFKYFSSFCCANYEQMWPCYLFKMWINDKNIWPLWKKNCWTIGKYGFSSVQTIPRTCNTLKKIKIFKYHNCTNLHFSSQLSSPFRTLLFLLLLCPFCDIMRSWMSTIYSIPWLCQD